MSNNKVYWKGYEELENEPEFVKNRDNEFAEDLPIDQFLGDESAVNTSTNRRDFLKFLGFSVTAATLAACETPIRKAIPYVIKPETITPGVANYYASSYYDGSDFYSIMVKTREGRPIKIDGNRLCMVTKGSTNARVQGSVLSLYDNKRSKTALKKGTPVSWTQADEEIKKSFAAIAAKGGRTVLLSNTIISPSTQAAINEFAAKQGNVAHIQYDAVSHQAIREAHKLTSGKAIIPSYNFDKAVAIASFGADFLNGWLMSSAYEKQYAETRRPDNKEMSRHFQFESILTMAGANADYRTKIRQSEIGVALVALHNYIAGKSGGAAAGNVKVAFQNEIAACGDYLLKNKGKALVVCGLNDINAQAITNRINEMLGSYGTTIDMGTPMNIYNGNDAAVMSFVKDLNDKKIAAVILYGTNPAYTMGEEFNAALANAELSISFGDRLEETAVQYVCPDHHYLESWNDYSPVQGHYTLQQPTIQPLFDTRSAQESMLVWAGIASRGNKNSTVYRDYIKAYWNTNLFPSSGKLIFEEFWNYSLHDGVAHINAAPVATEVKIIPPVTETPVTATAFDGQAAATKLSEMAASSKAWEVVLYEKVGIGTGLQANNPILLEFPDPITRVTWDNYITMAPEDMDKKEFGFNKMMGQKQWQHVAKVSVNGKSIELPVIAVPGQTAGTIGIAVGYGRKFGKTDDLIGKNAFPLMTAAGAFYSSTGLNATVEKTAAKYKVAGTQTHHTMMGRDIIKETSLAEYRKNPKSGNPDKTMHTNVKELIPAGHHEAPVGKIDYWKDFKMINHRWGLSIDLSTCTGCGSCVVSCHVENNVPVVGKDEVSRSRDMHWLRIDRYYTSDADPSTRYDRGAAGNDDYRKKEVPSNNPKVAFQPIMCQHCNHAPCETVCPVLATTHSTEGLNQMTYNRCVGTRYCANNCPYKVRRFNWFQYSDNAKFDFYMNDDLGKMVLNPDVTVRARGVMEKCSMCVQRIQEGKLNAKKESRMVKDQEIQTACSDACPTNAIVFGDYNDDASMIARLETKEPRSYWLLEEVGTKPNVIYQTKIRNVNEAYGHKEEAAHHEGGHDEGHDEHHESHDEGVKHEEAHSEHNAH